MSGDDQPGVRSYDEVLAARQEMVGVGLDVLLTADVAELLGVQKKTITQYLVESHEPVRGKPGWQGRYLSNPFPAPAGYAGKSPYWSRAQIPALRAWFENRPGRGAGGGRPRKDGQPNRSAAQTPATDQAS